MYVYLLAFRTTHEKASEYKDIEETNYINKDPQGEVTTNGITLRNTNLSSPNIARTNYSIYWKGDKTQWIKLSRICECHKENI